MIARLEPLLKVGFGQQPDDMGRRVTCVSPGSEPTPDVSRACQYFSSCSCTARPSGSPSVSISASRFGPPSKFDRRFFRPTAKCLSETGRFAEAEGNCDFFDRQIRIAKILDRHLRSELIGDLTKGRVLFLQSAPQRTRRH